MNETYILYILNVTCRNYPRPPAGTLLTACINQTTGTRYIKCHVATHLNFYRYKMDFFLQSCILMYIVYTWDWTVTLFTILFKSTFHILMWMPCVSRSSKYAIVLWDMTNMYAIYSTKKETSQFCLLNIFFKQLMLLL